MVVAHIYQSIGQPVGTENSSCQSDMSIMDDIQVTYLRRLKILKSRRRVSSFLVAIQLFQKRLSYSIVDTGTERNCLVQAAQAIYYY